MRTAETTLSPKLPALSVGRRVSRNGYAHFLNASQMKAIADQALMECKGGPATQKWRRQIEAIDRSGRFSRGALLSFRISRRGLEFRPRALSRCLLMINRSGTGPNILLQTTNQPMNYRFLPTW